jgi:lauroyl/myristoyl acyltransferase
MMEKFIARLARCLVLLVQALPLKFVARLGRAGGALAWWIDARHRRVMLENLAACFPEKSVAEIREIARENMLRIGENYASAVRTAAMDVDAVAEVCEVAGAEKFRQFSAGTSPQNCIVAIGHFGNFELNAILGNKVHGLRPVTTYRALNQPALNEVMQMIRGRSGCVFYERRSEAGALRNALNEGGVLLGLLSDQHSKGGVWGPFLGRNCSTTSAPAVLALRYDAELLTAICYRTALARWKIEVGDPIPTHENGEPRSIEAITGNINRAFEKAVLRDPANWFWVHKRWKAQKIKPNRTDSVEASLPAGPAIETGSP